MIFINYIILKILERDNTEITKVVDIARVNQQPSTGKLIRFGKKINPSWINNKDKRPKGVYYSWKTRLNDNDFINAIPIRKYRSPFEAEYNKTGYKRNEIILFAKPHKATAYIFYTKQTNRLYFGVTDSSFTFHPNETVCIYTKELNSLSEVPILIQVDMVNGKNNIEKINKDNRYAPVRTVILNFKPRIFSESINYNRLDTGIPGEPPDSYDIQMPATGFNLKKVLRKWLKYKNGIPKQIPIEEVASSSTAVMPRGNVATNPSRRRDKGKEPEDVAVARIQQNKRIEAAIENYLQNTEIPNYFTLETLPEADANGYIEFNNNSDIPQYNPMDPNSIFKGFLQGDNGDPVFFAINGKIKHFSTFDTEVKAHPNDFIFYWNPTDSSYGIRFKKHIERREKEQDNEEGNGYGDNNNEENENQPAPIINKYICIAVLGNPTTSQNSIDYNPMVPQIIDFYTSSYFNLGRLSYNHENIEKRDQISISLADLKKRYYNYKNKM